MKFCRALLGSRQCYKLFTNYTLRLHVKHFIQARRYPSFVQLESRFAGMKFSHVIPSACLGGIKKLGGDYMIPACQDEISTRPAETNFTPRLYEEIKFCPGKAGQFSTWYLIRFPCVLFEFHKHFILQNWRFIKFYWFKIFLLELFSLQLCLFFFIK